MYRITLVFHDLDLYRSASALIAQGVVRRRRKSGNRVPSIFITDDGDCFDDEDHLDAFDIVILVSEKPETVSEGTLVCSALDLERCLRNAIRQVGF